MMWKRKTFKTMHKVKEDEKGRKGKEGRKEGSIDRWLKVKIDTLKGQRGEEDG